MKILFSLIGTGLAVAVLLTPAPHASHHPGNAGKYIAAAVIIGVFWAIGALVGAFIKSRRAGPAAPTQATRPYGTPFGSSYTGRNVRR